MLDVIDFNINSGKGLQGMFLGVFGYALIHRFQSLTQFIYGESGMVKVPLFVATVFLICRE